MESRFAHEPTKHEVIDMKLQILNREVLTRCLTFAFIAILILALIGCQKKQATEQVAPLDRVGNSPTGTSASILHQTFTVRATTVYSFEIPAHAAMPHLRGNFKSYVTNVSPQSNDHSADVDFLVLSDVQYTSFSAGNPTESLFSSDSSHDQAVDVHLPPSLNESAKYYLVFRNTPGGDSKKTVQADLTIDF
jgi:hypothetical protein